MTSRIPNTHNHNHTHNNNNNNSHNPGRSQSDVEISFDGDVEHHPDDGHDVDDEFYDRKEWKQNRNVLEMIHRDNPDSYLEQIMVGVKLSLQ